MEPIIEFEHVRKSYGEKTVLGDFSLTVEPGDFVTIVGASGGGKTTVLKMVNGLLTPDAGTIRVMGRDIRAMDLIQLRRNIGYAIQGSVLFPHMTVAENIAYVPNLLNKKDKARTKAAVAKWLAIVGLDEELLLSRRAFRRSAAARRHRAGARRVARDPAHGRALRRRRRDHPRQFAAGDRPHPPRNRHYRALCHPRHRRSAASGHARPRHGERRDPAIRRAGRDPARASHRFCAPARRRRAPRLPSARRPSR